MLTSRTAVPLLSLAILATAPLARAGEPFEPGLRWARPAHLSDAWIPTSVGFAGRGELCWSVAEGAAPRVQLHASAERGLAQPLFTASFPEPVAGALRVTTTRSRDGLFVLRQRVGADPTRRDTLVSRYDPVAAAAGGAFAPAWTLDLGLQTNGPAHLLASESGERGFVLLWEEQTDELFVCRVDLEFGVLLGWDTWPATSLEGAAISADGSRLAVSTGTTLRVLDVNGQLVDQRGLFSATAALALDADGSHLLIGRFGGVQLLAEGAKGYGEVLLVGAASTELPKVVDLSADAGVLAVGWWDHQSGVDARLEVIDGATGAALFELDQSGTPGGLQNSPAAVEVSADGRRVAYGSWGDSDADPELVLVDVPLGATVLEANLPGSVLDLDLDASGTRLLVAAKHLHANQFGTTGELRLYDTGERDLQLLRAPRPGGTLHLAARAAGASAVWFLIGAELDAPFANGLALTRSGLRVLPAQVANGVAELELPLPDGNRILGLAPTIQAALRRVGSLDFSVELVRPVFL